MAGSNGKTCPVIIDLSQALTKEEPWHSQGVHRLVEGNYYIYYWIDEVRKRVKVTAVVYARREQRQQLSNMEWE